ncbi:hypothetical protein BU23DRAFT_574139 [Bimuria novae-zelandiae CBS 107.79]|uniref:Uncharacterized protein n=1 Tax=Bimuria novae-zelandiae CBS 107.79 TaxID=1447943 RepID=A0A6A5URC7_9PLEO|nr:hypothetical protein BU23DRAFT_574139 [Bimuria novae-zelandiae CBS 107.79]
MPGVRKKRERDLTGQICPPGVSPNVTATIWEAEGTLLFHVEVQPEGVTIARREDDQRIHADALMALEDRLRAEIEACTETTYRFFIHVVKDGPAHLRGMW